MRVGKNVVALLKNKGNASLLGFLESEDEKFITLVPLLDPITEEELEKIVIDIKVPTSPVEHRFHLSCDTIDALIEYEDKFKKPVIKNENSL